MAEQAPFVSIVIPNFNGMDHLEECLSSLERLDYPALDLNGPSLLGHILRYLLVISFFSAPLPTSEVGFWTRPRISGNRNTGNNHTDVAPVGRRTKTAQQPARLRAPA